MHSRVEVAPDSEAEEADDDAVPYTLYHREKESMEFEYAKKAPDPEAILSLGAVNAAKAKELDPQRMLLVEGLTEMPLQQQRQMERVYSNQICQEAWETAKNLQQNNPASVRPRVWLHSDQIPGYRLHKIVGVEGIIHLHDLTSQMEHRLHLTEPVKPFLPPPDPFQERKDPVLKFLEKHERTSKEKLVSKV